MNLKQVIAALKKIDDDTLGNNPPVFFEIEPGYIRSIGSIVIDPEGDIVIKRL